MIIKMTYLENILPNTGIQVPRKSVFVNLHHPARVLSPRGQCGQVFTPKPPPRNNPVGNPNL